MMPEFARHLWQSTVFGAAIALMAVAFRKNRAQVRYLLWLSASLKFLVPFVVLTNLGILLGERTPAARHVANVVTNPVVSRAVGQVSGFVFAEPAATPIAPDGIPSFAAAIFGIWFCGFVVIVALRVRAWLRVREVLAGSHFAPIATRIEVRHSRSLSEPSVAGIFRPVLLLPEGIADRLTPSQMEAILAHELCHVRRRDNMFAVIHMIVETVFWFHPLVWWIGARLVEERERACDEEVLRLGNQPGVYADAIVDVCRFYTESPIACVSGVSGAGIKRRIEMILSGCVAQEMSRVKKSLLILAGGAVLLLPVAVGIMLSPLMKAQEKLKFEVASVKQTKSDAAPNSNFPLGPGDVYVRNGGYFSATGFPLFTYIAFAYKMMGNDAQYLLPQLPDWAKTEHFDIEARASGDPGKDQMRLMMRSLLADRFGLVLRYEDKEATVLAWVLANSGKTGSQLKKHADQGPCPTELPTRSAPVITAGSPAFCNGIYPMPPSVAGLLRFGGRNVTIAFIANTLSASMGRPMVDHTGLAGTFDFTLEWLQERNDSASSNNDASSATDAPSGPSFAEALRDQLGIKLESQKGSVQVPVIDHVQRPSEN